MTKPEPTPPPGPHLGGYIGGYTFTATGTNGTWICPDLLSIRNIGAADGWRGRVVRAFFVVLRKVTGV